MEMETNNIPDRVIPPADRTLSAVKETISPISEAMGFRILQVKWAGGRGKTLQVTAENGMGSMSIDECAELSRALSAVLDVEDPISSPYILEVTSPGIDRPLVSIEDFQAHVGQRAKIKLREPLDGRKSIRGSISSVSDHSVLLSGFDGGRDGKIEVPIVLMSEAKLLISDDLINESLKKGKLRKRRNLASQAEN